MDSMTLIAVASIVTAGLTTSMGCMCPALGEGRAVATAPGPMPNTGQRILVARRLVGEPVQLAPLLGE